MKSFDSIASVSVCSILFLSSLAHAQEAPAAADTAEAPAAADTAEAPAAADTAEAPAAADTAEAPGSAASASAVRGRGFYLRMTGGPGYTWAKAPETNQLRDATVGAWTGNVSVHPGYMLAPGFAVHGDVFVSMSLDYQVTSESESPEFESVTRAITSQTFGAGLTYHSMPMDIYLSAGAGVSLAQAVQWHYSEISGGTEGTISSRHASTDPGFGAHASLGKLWSLSKAWAIGASLSYNYQSFGRKLENVLSLKQAHTLWLGFSGTFQPQ